MEDLQGIKKGGVDKETKGKRSKTVKCSRCKKFWYNIKTCKNRLTVKHKKDKSVLNGKRTTTKASSSNTT